MIDDTPSVSPPLQQNYDKSVNWENEVLKLDSWSEVLSPIQLEKRNKINKEINEVNTRINQLISEYGSETIFEGDSCVLFELGSKKVAGII